jgi:outer membrane receptor protein involved in Fe transport
MVKNKEILFFRGSVPQNIICQIKQSFYRSGKWGFNKNQISTKLRPSFFTKTFLLLMGLFFTETTHAQQSPPTASSSPKGTLSGIVTDNNKQGISHVYILLGTDKFAAITNGEGKFSFSITPGDYEITFSHLQYKNLTKHITIAQDGKTDISIILKDAIFNMDEVTVTGSAASMELKKLPSSISIIKPGDPEFNSITTIDDALSYVPGVYVDRSRGLTTTGSLTQVSLRGTGAANRTLVLKDGIPLNNSYTGSVTEWNTMATNAISRIEVVKGAASSLYGSNAMGGVINLVTENPKEKPAMAASAEYGSMNNTLLNFKAGKILKNGLGIMLLAEYKQTDGYQYMHDTLWTNYYQKPNNKLLNVTAKLNYHLGNSGLIEFVGDFHHENSLSGTSTQYDGIKKRGNFLLRYKTFWSGYSLNLTAYTNRAKSESDATKWDKTSQAFSNAYYSSDLPYNETGFVGKVNTITGSNNLTVGADIRYYDMESNYEYHGSGINKYKGEQIFYSGFINDEISLTEMINLSLGLRYDYWQNKNGTFKDNTSGEMIAFSYPSKTDYAFSPKAGVVFHPSDKFRLRTSCSTGFKAPSMYYLYRSAPHGATTFDLGNPDLKPEKMSFSYEIGGDFYLNDKLEISGTYYISEFKDFQDKVTIDRSEVPDYFSPGEGVSVRQSVNIGKVRLQGVEASLRYKITRFLTGVASYTLSESEILKYETDEAIEGNELEDSPKCLASTGALYNNPKLFSAGIWFKYTGEQYADMENTPEKKVDRFELVNMNISRSFIKNKFTLSVSVDNLFDKQYYGYYGSSKSYYYGPPRTIMGKISYKL